MAYPSDILKKAREEFNKRKEDFKIKCERERLEVYSKIPEAALLEREISSTGFKISSLILKGGDIEKGLEEIKKVNEEDQKALEELLVKNGFSKDALSSRYLCPICHDTGVFDNKACVCLERIRRSLMYERLGGFKEENCPSFSDLKLSYYGENKDLMENTLRKCYNYGNDFSLSSKSLLFFGGVGLGKTHVSKAIGKMAVDKGFDVFYIPFTTLSQKLENAKFRKNDDSYDDLINPVLDCELLILDDVGAEFTTSFTVSLLYEIVNSRLIRNLPTIINTNLNDTLLREKYGERTCSRLLACYSVMMFKGSDIRMKIKFNLE